MHNQKILVVVALGPVIATFSGGARGSRRQKKHQAGAGGIKSLVPPKAETVGQRFFFDSKMSTRAV